MPDETIRVYVHLAHAQDAAEWRARWARGEVVGINDSTPYGYGRAEQSGLAITFSTSHREALPGKILRFVLRLILGFDVVHAWRNRRDIECSDVVWTHTESSFLAISSVLALLKSTKAKPYIIGQSVWLYDNWPRYFILRRMLFKHLMRRVDVLTTLSPDNAEDARRIFSDKPVRFLHFGIPNEESTPPSTERRHPIEILSLGNDRHRDWKTLVGAVRDQADLTLTILSSSAPHRLAKDARNITITRARTNDELNSYFGRASVVVVPLFANRHASGITVIEEAVLKGVPVIATDTGGLKAYFDDDMVTYVPAEDQDALRDAIQYLVANPETGAAKARRAQERIKEIGCDQYIMQHVAISRELLGA